MKNNLKKPFFWLIAIFLAAEPAVAKDLDTPYHKMGYDQSHAIKSQTMTPAYNAPARIDVRGAWDFYVTGSFIYWHMTEEGLALGISDANAAGLPMTHGRVIHVDFKYKPGFKVALGVNSEHDDWDGYIEYTRLHGSHSVSSSAEQPNGTFYQLWFHPNNLINASSASTQWRADLDFLDFELARCFYVGTHLTFRPHFGGRAAWIDQDFNISATTTDAIPLKVKSHNRSRSWGLGARAGINSNWVLGCGFRLFGNVVSDLLFTRYKLKREEQTATNPAGVLAVELKDTIRYLRPHNEFDLGIGWGSYFEHNTWHVDFAASYDFHIFWNQNMFRHFYNTTNVGTSSITYGDLFLHGLTAKARFDF